MKEGYLDFEEYIQQGEPDKKEKASIWRTAIGPLHRSGLSTASDSVVAVSLGQRSLSSRSHAIACGFVKHSPPTSSKARYFIGECKLSVTLGWLLLPRQPKAMQRCHTCLHRLPSQREWIVCLSLASLLNVVDMLLLVLSKRALSLPMPSR